MFGVKLDGFRVCGLLANLCELQKKYGLKIANYLRVSRETICRIVLHSPAHVGKFVSEWRFDRKTVNDWLKAQSAFHCLQGKVENG